MNLWIQACTPTISGDFDPEDEVIGEAIETVFPLRTETALVVWQRVYVPLGYKYDFSVIVDDLMDLIEELLRSTSGRTEVSWASNTFRVDWRLAWQDGEVVIEAAWHSVVGGVEARLNRTDPVVLSVMQFVAEWKRPLDIIARGLIASGYSPSNLDGLGRLQQLLALIPSEGVLYS